jgi:inorganic triphosphatase YgiF
MTELELKFGIPPAVRRSLQQALQAHGARRMRLQAHYFDTADGLLAQRRIALRVRLEGRRWVQTLKAPGDGVMHRIEHEVPLPDRGSAVPQPDLRRHAEGPAAALVAELLQAAPALLPRHGTTISRLLCRVQAGESTLELALDHGQAQAGERSTAIDELEIEHCAGPVQPLFELAIAWVEHGGLWLSTINKAQRGERLSRPESTVVAPHAEPVALGAEDNGATVLRALLQAALAHVLANASELAEGRDEAATVHQLRVALRRLRTLLRELGSWSPVLQPGWDEALAQTARALGRQRDQQALAISVQPLLEAAGAPRLQWQPPEATDAGAVVRERAFQRTLLELLALAHGSDASFAALEPTAVRKQLAARLGRLQRRLARDAQHFERLALDEQHRVRKRLKRLRYLAEFTAALWPAPALQRYLRRARQAQQALGAHNDGAVAAQAFRADAAQHPEAWFAAGWLQAHQAQTAREARKALKKLAATAGFWA